ncbi:MAG: 2-alkenal reductase, partial [Telluria sp.]
MKNGTIHELGRPRPLRKLWLLFAQAVTVALALYFVVLTLRPEWLQRAPTQVALGSPGIAGRVVPVLQGPQLPASGSYREAAGRAMPAVVNILTSKASR